MIVTRWNCVVNIWWWVFHIRSYVYQTLLTKSVKTIYWKFVCGYIRSVCSMPCNSYRCSIQGLMITASHQTFSSQVEHCLVGANLARQIYQIYYTVVIEFTKEKQMSGHFSVIIMSTECYSHVLCVVYC